MKNKMILSLNCVTDWLTNEVFIKSLGGQLLVFVLSTMQCRLQVLHNFPGRTFEYMHIHALLCIVSENGVWLDI